MSMKRIGLVVMALGGLTVVSGCCSLGKKDSASLATLDSRVSVLEGKVDSLEGGAVAPRLDREDEQVRVENTGSSVSPEEMTKKDIQEALKNAGYYDGAIDGKFGAMTTQAIRDFQENAGLKVDGVAGPRTKEKLVKYLP